MNKDIKIFTCSCSTMYCNCIKNFTSSTATSVSNISTTTEMYINGEKVTKKNPIKAIFNRIISRQKKKDVKEAVKQKKLLMKANKMWVNH
mgnify:CR=1 FL=1|jgi:hypothetical protein|tara:strand:+ start:304 stop:573 length:270 start_codon:yes stop_codon:yes gene_type:complete